MHWQTIKTEQKLRAKRAARRAETASKPPEYYSLSATLSDGVRINMPARSNAEVDAEMEKLLQDWATPSYDMKLKAFIAAIEQFSPNSQRARMDFYLSRLDPAKRLKVTHKKVFLKWARKVWR